jgi:hypothetical protein
MPLGIPPNHPQFSMTPQHTIPCLAAVVLHRRPAPCATVKKSQPSMTPTKLILNNDSTPHLVNDNVEARLILVAFHERCAAGAKQQLVLTKHALQLLHQ